MVNGMVAMSTGPIVHATAVLAHGWSKVVHPSFCTGAMHARQREPGRPLRLRARS